MPGGLPWLFADPRGAAAAWRARLTLLLGELRREAAACGAAITADVSSRTRERLGLLEAAYGDHADRLAGLLEPFGTGTAAASHDTLQALRTRLPGSQGLTNYYANIHRDWAWGEDENQASLALLTSVIDAGLAGERVLVLGAGAGRLAYDLHRAQQPALTFAMDINPLLLAVAREMYAGRSLELYEFPIAPRGIADHARLRTLRAPAPADERLHLIAGDALHAPFEPGTFDVVVTPWFIDIVEAPFTLLAARVNGLLADGGRWLNLGSVAFASAQRAQQLSLEEALQVVQQCGFAPPVVREAELPYMRSPASRHARIESTVAWCARRHSAATEPAAPDLLPPYLLDATLPVPLPPELVAHAAATRIHAFLLSLIDGRRSLADIAGVLVEQRMMAPADAAPAVRAFLLRLHEDAARRANY